MGNRVESALLLGFTAAALASCAAPPPPAPPEPEVMGQYYAIPNLEQPLPLAAAMWIAVPLLEAGHAEAPDPSLVEPIPGWFTGPPFPVGEDGTVELDFPEPDADLEALLLPAEDVFAGVDPMQCEVTVSDAAVEVTPLVFELITSPGLVTLTADGVAPTLITSEPVTVVDLPSFAQHTFHGFAYASGPVEVSAVSAGCLGEGLEAELSLQEGWNVLAWTIHLDAMDAFEYASVTVVEMPDPLYLTTPGL